jgi:hypothetical protein
MEDKMVAGAEAGLRSIYMLGKAKEPTCLALKAKDMSTKVRRMAGAAIRLR